MKTKIIPINPEYQWEIEYDGYIYAQLKKKSTNWFWGDTWINASETVLFSLRKDYKGSGHGSSLQGMFFGRCQTIGIQEFDLDTFDLSVQLDREWSDYAKRRDMANYINKQIENIIDRA